MRKLTLLAPGVLGPGPENGLDLKVLELILARSNVQAGFGRSLERLLFNLFDVDIPEEQDLPVAPVTYSHDSGVLNDGWWYRADPVYCRPDQDRIIMMTNRGLGIKQIEADNLVKELNSLVSSEGWEFQALTPYRWYVRMPSNPNVRTKPLPEVLGKNIFPHFPKRDKQPAWQSLMTELQMLLHGSPTNALRQSRGQMPINNIWIWGGGVVPNVPDNKWSQVWSNEPVTLGLAMLSHADSSSLPSSGDEWLQQASPSGAHLVVIYDDENPSYGGIRDDWMDYASNLNHTWFDPLFKALRSGQLDELNVWPANGQLYTITRKTIRRWWRRSHPLRNYWS
jgi:hypothetical protein